MIRRRGLRYEAVLDRVKSRIADGTYLPGQRLPSVVALAGEVGVGISTVREGLRVLEGLGLIRIQHGRGIFVSEELRWRENPAEALTLTEDATLLYILEVRRLLEPEAAGLTAERASPAQVSAIMAAAKEQERQILTPGGDPVPADFGFHSLLIEAAHNPVLSRMVSSIGELLLDGRQARSLMGEHMADLTNDVLNYLTGRHAQHPASPERESDPS